MPNPRLIPCDICGRPSLVLVNGFGGCVDHLEEAFDTAIRLTMMNADVPADERPDLERSMKRELWWRFIVRSDETDIQFIIGKEDE